MLNALSTETSAKGAVDAGRKSLSFDLSQRCGFFPFADFCGVYQPQLGKSLDSPGILVQ